MPDKEDEEQKVHVSISVLDSMFIIVVMGIMVWSVIGKPLDRIDKSLNRIADALDRAYPK